MPTASPPRAALVMVLDASVTRTTAVVWLTAIRAAAGVGCRILRLVGRRDHPLSLPLWTCAVGLGMAVELAPPAPGLLPHAGGPPCVVVDAAGMPRLLVPDGIPLEALPDLAGPEGGGTTDLLAGHRPLLRALLALANPSEPTPAPDPDTRH